MKDDRNVNQILNEWEEPQNAESSPLAEAAMHPMQAIQTIQTALSSMESHIQDARLAYRDYGKGAHGSMSSIHSDEQLLNMLVKASEKMMRSAKKVNIQAVKAVKAHKALGGQK